LHTYPLSRFFHNIPPPNKKNPRKIHSFPTAGYPAVALHRDKPKTGDIF
jgi:hypothetical protein